MKKNIILSIIFINILTSIIYIIARSILALEKISDLFDWIGLWVISPYIFLILIFLTTKFKKYLISSLVVSIICLILTLLIYNVLDASIDPFTFLVGPIFLNIILLVMYIIGIKVESKKK